MSTEAEFSATSAWKTLDSTAKATGLGTAGARLMRLGENALFHLPAEDIVVRVARTMDYWDDAEKEVNVARWLSHHCIPAAELADVTQPLDIAGKPVTFWKFIHGRAGDERDIETLGHVLRRLHETPAPTDFTLPTEDILERVRPRIDTSAISSSDKQFLLRRLHHLASEVAVLKFPLNPAPTHGDAHSENLMIRGGEPILIDFERFAWGQPEWDLSMTATEYLTAGWWTDEQYRKFSEAYGYDVTSWHEGFPTLRAVHELKMTTWLMQNVTESPEIADEFAVRMRTMRGEENSGWRPF